MSPDPSSPPPQKRSTLRTVFGWVFIGFTALAILGTLSALAGGAYASPANGAELLGMLCGALCLIGVPLGIGLLLLRRPRNRPPRQPTG